MRGAAFIAIASDESDETVRQQTRLIAEALSVAKRQLDELGVGSFVRRASIVLDHPAYEVVHRLRNSANLLAVALQNERFTPQQVSVSVAARRHLGEHVDALWRAIWDDRAAADDDILVGHLLTTNLQLAQLLEQLTAFAAKALLGVEDAPTDT